MKVRINNTNYLATGTAEAIILALLPMMVRQADPLPVEPVPDEPATAVVTPPPVVVLPKPDQPDLPDQTVIQWLFPDGTGRWLLRVLGASKPQLTVDGQAVTLNEGGETRDKVYYPYFGFFKSGKSSVPISLTLGGDTYTGTLDLSRIEEHPVTLEATSTDALQTASVAARPLTHVKFVRLTPIINS